MVSYQCTAESYEINLEYFTAEVKASFSIPFLSFKTFYEAFVFFVNEDNPVSHLSTQQIKDIYHGDITNWQKVGGLNKDILAFQRPERSGSQAMMSYFMGDIPLKKPLQYEYISGMSGIISDTAQYNGEKDAIGYTFRYFLEGLHQEEDVKIF